MGQIQSERVARQLRELYRRYGYTKYKMSKFEPYDLYVHNKSFLVSEDILTFTDADGQLMALKPDVTLSIVKNAKEGAGLQKVYYSENVYRTSPMTRGFREIMQMGLECVGAVDLVAMGEVLQLAARSLEQISRDYLLDISHLGFVAGLLDRAGVEEKHRTNLLTYMGEKNVPELLACCEELGLSSTDADRLCCLTTLYGSPQKLLPELERMAQGKRMALALEELKNVCVLVPEDHLRLDFSIVNNMDYYNGLIFRGYLPGLPSGVLSGGRYDNLLHQMGRADGAIGFAVYMDLLERLETSEDAYDADVLLLYDDESPAPAVLQEAEGCRRAGQSVRVDRQAPEGLSFRTVRKVG